MVRVSLLTGLQCHLAYVAGASRGLKNFVIEQDNVAQNGADSMAAARANYQGLVKVLS